MKEVTLKVDDFCRVSVQKGRGYIIRMHEYCGATFVISESGKIEVGQSSRMMYDIADWRRLQVELEAGIKYMSKVIMCGGNYGTDLAGRKAILVRDYRHLALYRRYNGALMFWIGKATIIKDSYGCSGNREGSPYVFIEVDTDFEVAGFQVVGSGLNIATTKECRAFCDSSVTQNKKFMDLLWSYPGDWRMIDHLYINNQLVCQYRWNL